MKYLLFPIIVFAIGDIIHIINFVNMFLHRSPATIWIVCVNLSMLIIDTTIIIGLIIKLKWIYYAAIIVLGLFSIIQIISLFVLKTILLLEIDIAIIICFSCAIFMIITKNKIDFKRY